MSITCSNIDSYLKVAKWQRNWMGICPKIAVGELLLARFADGTVSYSDARTPQNYNWKLNVKVPVQVLGKGVEYRDCAIKQYAIVREQ